jgi:hypothetical protein
VGLLSSAVAATCAAYYIASPTVQRVPSITAESGVNARKHEASRPVRLADSDGWIASLRTHSYWRQKSNQTFRSRPSETSRSRPQVKSRNEKKEQYGGRRGAHRSLSASASFSMRSQGAHSGRNQDTYRTVCVRLCDGFFWPVSFATTKLGLKRDDETCQAACESPVAHLESLVRGALCFDAAIARILREHPDGLTVSDLVAEVGKAPEMTEAPGAGADTKPNPILARSCRSSTR